MCLSVSAFGSFDCSSEMVRYARDIYIYMFYTLAAHMHFTYLLNMQREIVSVS